MALICTLGPDPYDRCGDQVTEPPRTLRSAERKLHAFVSSVTAPLRAARHEVGQEIERLGMHPWVFEETPPSGEELENSYLRHIPDSEFFIWLVDATTSAPTAREVRLAMDSPKPSLIVVEVDVESRDAETQALLDEARSRVRTRSAASTRENCGEVVRLALLDELNRAKQWEISQKRALHQLPAALSNFVDREAQLAEIAEKLANPGASIVVSGMGGVGKSALAVAASHLGKSNYPAAQLYMDLRDPAGGPLDSVEVVANLLRMLGVPGGALSPDPTEMVAQLRTLLAERGSLILLDNARDGAQVEPVLSAVGDGAMLVTSRDPLREVDVTLRLPLTPFEQSDSVELLEAIIGRDRVARERQAAQKIANLCGDLPLALRLAGARLVTRPAWAISDYAGALEDEHQRLQRLDEGEPGLRASFNLSYSELDATDAALFVATTAFDGDFGPESSAALVDREAGDTRLRLEGLVDAGLLLAIGMSRYRFHELVRLFAQERLGDHFSPEEYEVALAGLADWYTEEATKHRARIRPGGEYL